MGSSKSDKIVAIIEVVVLLILMIGYFIKVCLPDIKKNIGSSDKIISYTNYLNMFEVNIDGDVDFAFAINKDYKINHIMFFSKNSRCLYNQNIEKSSSNKEAIDSAVKLLISNNLLTTTSIIKVTKYNDDYYSKFKKYFDEVLNKYGIDNSYLEESSDLIKKSSLLGSDTESEADALRNIEYYSKEIVRHTNVSKNHNSSSDDNIILDDSSSKSLSNSVYKSIEKYVVENNISNLERGNQELIISMIPADASLKYYPSDSSWYYVSNGKIYAYIEFRDNSNSYGYCYSGSIDLIKNGVC